MAFHWNAGGFPLICRWLSSGKPTAFQCKAEAMATVCQNAILYGLDFHGYIASQYTIFCGKQRIKSKQYSAFSLFVAPTGKRQKTEFPFLSHIYNNILIVRNLHLPICNTKFRQIQARYDKATHKYGFFVNILSQNHQNLPNLSPRVSLFVAVNIYLFPICRRKFPFLSHQPSLFVAACSQFVAEVGM